MKEDFFQTFLFFEKAKAKKKKMLTKNKNRSNKNKKAKLEKIDDYGRMFNKEVLYEKVI